MSKAAELAKAGETLTNQPSGRKNLVTNGAMQVAQRSTSTTGIGAADNNFPCVDRMKVRAGSTAGRATVSQVADGPSGFANCLKFDCTTADASIAAGEYFFLQYGIEGQDLQQLKKGTSDAEKFTVSFYVKGNANATYTCEIKDQDNTRYIAQEFSVTSSWSKVSLTFNNETSNSLDDDNAESMRLTIWLHAGSTYTGGTFTSNTWFTTVNQRVGDNQTSFFDSTDREFFITGVQMEIGSQATNFEHRSFGEELALCKRYYEIMWGGSSDYPNSLILYKANSTTEGMSILKFATPKRAGGTFAHTGTPVMYPGGNVTSVASDTFGILGGRARFTPTTNIVANESGHIDGNGSTAVADAEL